MVPVCTQAPPGAGSASTRATRFLKYAACAAPFSPAGPPPMTTRSYRSSPMSESVACRAVPVNEEGEAEPHRLPEQSHDREASRDHLGRRRRPEEGGEPEGDEQRRPGP